MATTATSQPTQERPDVGVIYPSLETTLVYRPPGRSPSVYYVPSCCFHDLRSATSGELAGMGLAIIGNLCKLLGRDVYNPIIDASLRLTWAARDKGIRCPWPGMPDDRPMELDLTQLPFEVAMFVDDDGGIKHRPARLDLMLRIEQVWVPWLLSQLEQHA